jgi:hypothetical protein
MFRQFPRAHRFLPLMIGLIIALFSLLWQAWSWLAMESTALAQNAPNSKDEVIYIDNEGYIRVLDYWPDNLARLTNAVQWVSPDKGWEDFAIGDFNADGDSEILALRRASGPASALAIYDPVIGPSVTATPLPGQIINEIPWEQLPMGIVITDNVISLAAGNLDASVAGDEMVYGILDEVGPGSLETHERFHLHLLRRTNPVDANSPFTSTFLLRDDLEAPSFVIGNIDNQGNDELVMVSNEDSTLQIFRYNGQLERLFVNTARTRPWRAAVIGPYELGGPAEVVAVRKAEPREPTFIVFRYELTEEGYFDDRYRVVYMPEPRRIAFADIDGNGPEEIFILRNWPTTTSFHTTTPTPPPPPNFFGLVPTPMNLTPAPPQTPAFEVQLDRDNGYQLLGAGNLDEDNRDELVVARNNNIRLYLQPNVSPFTPTDFNLLTNQKSLQVANLDRNGYLQLSRFLSNPGSLEVVLPAGMAGVAPSSILLSSAPALPSLNFVARVDGDHPWLSISPLSGQTPTTFILNLNAYGLAPLNTYQANVIFTISNLLVANPLVVLPVQLTVEPGLWPRPATMVAGVNCATGVTPEVVKDVYLAGLISVKYTATLVFIDQPDLPEAPWVSFTPVEPLLPTFIDFTFQPDNMPTGKTYVQAYLQVNAKSNVGEPLQANIPLKMFCADHHLFLPIIGNDSG